MWPGHQLTRVHCGLEHTGEGPLQLGSQGHGLLDHIVLGEHEDAIGVSLGFKHEAFAQVLAVCEDAIADEDKLVE